MPIYKAYWIDTRTNLVRSDTIDASDDEHACVLASLSDKGSRQEIWQGERFVGSIELNCMPNRAVAKGHRV